MKWKMFVAVLGFGILFLGTGCSQAQKEPVKLTQSEVDKQLEKTNATPSVKKLLSQYPNIINSFKEIPLEYQYTLAVPDPGLIPFEVKEVKIEYNPYSPGEIDVVYKGSDKYAIYAIISVWVWDKPLTDAWEEIRLNKDIAGVLISDKKTLAVDWKYSDKSIWVYRASLSKADPENMAPREHGFSEEEVINIANSVIANYLSGNKSK